MHNYGEGENMLRCGIDMIENRWADDVIARLGERFFNRFFTPGNAPTVRTNRPG